MAAKRDAGGGKAKQRNGESSKDKSDLEGMSPMARAWVEAGPYLGIGWVFVFSIGSLGLLGYWLDGKLGTGRLLLVGGLLFGMLVGFVNFFKVVQGTNRRKQQ